MSNCCKPERPVPNYQKVDGFPPEGATHWFVDKSPETSMEVTNFYKVQGTIAFKYSTMGNWRQMRFNCDCDNSEWDAFLATIHPISEFNPA